MTYAYITRAGLLLAALWPGLTLAAGLNDTGITQCGDDDENNLTCPQAGFPSQDAETGRDAQAGLQKAGGGSAGFDFTKLDSNGVPLPADATSWDCVRDNVTGLVWEVKTNDSGLRHQGWTYTWYNPDSNTNGGNAGSTGSNTCGGFLSNQCNTLAYAAAVNALTPALCGFSDWRMPTREQLLTIVDYSRFNPAIATDYFPRTVSNWYWSASPFAPVAGAAWGVVFFGGYVSAVGEGGDYPVRLVRGGQ